MWTYFGNGNACISRSSQIWRTTLANDFLGGKTVDLITQYSDIILKKIMMKIQKDKKSKERAELVKLEMAETGSGVRTSRHWKAATNIEFYYKEIQKGFDQMRELDKQTGWSQKLHQDRFKFVEKYKEILDEYMEDSK